VSASERALAVFTAMTDTFFVVAICHACPARTRTRQNKGAVSICPFFRPPFQYLAVRNDDQLRSLGLYAAPTLGDGNCLFRALSDQYFGTPSQHLKLREDICNWLEEHKQRYAPFVDDDRGMDVHLRCMRQPGTYGGHLELTAFAHFKKRDVKVIQPGLVYVIEWAAGADLSPTTSDMPKPGSPEPESDSDRALNSREARKVRREKKKELKNHAANIKQQAVDAGEEAEDVSSPSGAVYVAYVSYLHLYTAFQSLTHVFPQIPRLGAFLFRSESDWATCGAAIRRGNAAGS